MLRWWWGGGVGWSRVKVLGKQFTPGITAVVKIAWRIAAMHTYQCIQWIIARYHTAQRLRHDRLVAQLSIVIETD